MKVRCRLFGHDWRPDQVHLFGVCRRCPAVKTEPHPFQISPDRFDKGGILHPAAPTMELHPEECLIRPNGSSWFCIRPDHAGRDCQTKPFDFDRDIRS